MVNITTETKRAKYPIKRARKELSELYADIKVTIGNYNSCKNDKKKVRCSRLLCKDILYMNCELVEICCFVIVKYLLKQEYPIMDSSNKCLTNSYRKFICNLETTSDERGQIVTRACSFLIKLIDCRNRLMHRVYLTEDEKQKVIDDLVSLLGSSEEVHDLIRVILTYHEDKVVVVNEEDSDTGGLPIVTLKRLSNF